MESRRSGERPTINTTPFDATAFLQTIARDPEEAYGLIQGQVPLEGPATPRAQALIDAGEWDAGDRVSIACLKEDRCSGLVAQSSDPNAPVRFCGRKLPDCSFLSHNTVRWNEFRAGWFIPAGSSSKHGYFQQPMLPLLADGGPIDLTIARAINDATGAFRLTVGQWKFVMEAWWDARVIELSDDPTSSATPSSERTDYATPRTAPHAERLGRSGEDRPSLELEELSSDDEEDDVLTGTKDDDVGESLARVNVVASELRNQLASLALDLDEMRAGLENEKMEHARTRSAVNKLRSQGRSSSHRSFSPTANTGDPRVVELETRVRTLEGQAASVTATVRSISGLTTRMDDILTDPAGEFHKLADAVNRLENQLNIGGGVEAHGARFGTPSEIPAWLANIPNALGIFHDAVTVLHSIGAPSASHKQVLAMMKHQKDVAIKSELEARVITSFKTKLPAILYGATSTSDDEYVELGSKLKSYQVWHSDDGSSGVSQKILAESGIHEVRKRVGALAKHSTSLAPILRLSDGLMSDAIHFIQRFVLFIDTWVLDLKDGTFFSESQVWDIMVATIETVFDELRAARAPVQDVGSDDRSMLLWGILKAHEVMKRFLQHEFINDPAISGILIQKMIRQSPAATSGARLASMEKNLNSTMSKMVTLTTKVANLEAKQ